MITTTQTTTPSTIVDVLSGNKPIKAEAALSTKSMLILGAIVITVILIGTLIVKRVK